MSRNVPARYGKNAPPNLLSDLLTKMLLLECSLGGHNCNRHRHRDPVVGSRRAADMVRQHVRQAQDPGHHGLFVPRSARRPFSAAFGLFLALPDVGRATVCYYKQSTFPTVYARLVHHICHGAEPQELSQVLLHRDGLSIGL